MSSTPASLRRRAACAVLAPVLDEAAVLDALRLQHDTQRGDGVADVIAFIDAVATRHLLDQATRKRLYQSYFEALRRPEDQLPIDPWPNLAEVIQQTRAAPPRPPAVQAAPALQAPAQSLVSPAAAPLVHAVPSPLNANETQAANNGPARNATPGAAPDEAAEPHQQVFAALMQALTALLQQFHPGALQEIREHAQSLLPQLRVSASVRSQVESAWRAGADATWRISASESSLADIVNQSYVALCESLGPVQADRVLTQSVRQAEHSAAARQFSPRRFI